MTDLGIVRRLLKKAYQEAAGKGGWRLVGKQFGVSPAMAWRIVRKKYEPKDAKIRVRLGLPAMIQVSACAVCGEAHLMKRCPKKIIKYYDLFSMPVDELRWALENRIKMR